MNASPRGPSALPHVPRAQWTEHPHFPRQTLLLRSHEAFRAYSDALVEQARAGTSPPMLAWRFRNLLASMSGHEAYEEGKLYPYLELRWGLDLGPLRDDHEALHALADEVQRDLGEGSSGEAALAAHNAALHAHLDREEEQVIPALLGLQPDEFDRYYHRGIRTLLADLRAER